MSSPAVSVVIPVFNRREDVYRAVRSVLTQTFQQLEVVVVDDGSTDGSGDAVAALGDARVRVVRHDRNHGGGAARNSGIRASSAPLVAFLDSDDEWLPQKIERQIAQFASARPSPALVYTGAEILLENGRVETRVARVHRNPARALLTRNVIGETSVAMVTRQALEAVGGFDEALPCSQDKDLWLRLAMRFPLACVPDPLVRLTRAPIGRISTDVQGTIRGRDLFRRKHLGALLENGMLHEFLRDSAWVHLRQARDGRAARRCSLESIAAKPTALVSYGVLALACCPSACLDALAAAQRRFHA